MEKQSQDRDSSDSSRKNVEAIYQEEEETSQAFQLGHFYDRKHLNIHELKLRLSAFKHSSKQPNNKNNKTISSPIHIVQDEATAKFGRSSEKREEEKGRNTDINKRLYFEKNTTHYSQPQSYRTKNEDFKHSSQWNRKHPIVRVPTETNWQIKSTTNYNKPSALAALRYRQLEHKRRIKTLVEKQDASKCSKSPSPHRSFQDPPLQAKIKLTSQGEISQLQGKIQFLWNHYQLMTRILMSLRDGIVHQKTSVISYIEIVCSKKMEFLKEFLEILSGKSTSKQETALINRIQKVTALSRIFELLGIAYVSLFIAFGEKPNAHLVNCIGYATSSITFIIKLFSLVYNIQPPLSLSADSLSIIQTISQFQRGTYGKAINRVSEVALRLQQNNEVMTIVQGKLCVKMNKQFQETVSNLLKNIDLDSKPFYEYSQYLFEFIAFHLATLKVHSYFPEVQRPPAPYFSFFPKKRTLVVEPWGVFFAKKEKQTFIRAHTQHFLSQIGKVCNIVYWSDLMPKDVDDLLERLPSGRWLYRYHCIYAKDCYIKSLERLGCDPTHTLIIDRAEDNFFYNKDSGLMLPWKAKKRDTKLLELLDLLQPALTNDKVTFSEYIGVIKAKIAGAIRKKTPLRHNLWPKIPSSEGQLLPQRLSRYK